MTPSVSWLHVSDLHFGPGRDAHHRFDQDLVVSRLLQDCEDLQKQHGTPDFVVVTGDVAFSGENDQYERAALWLAELKRAVAAKRRSVFIVPGNHDVARGKALASPTSRVLHKKLRSSPKDLDEFLNSSGVDPIWPKFEEYAKFAAALKCPITPAQPFWSQKRRNGLGEIAIVGLNTALLSFDNEDAPDNLALGRGQIVKAILREREDRLLVVLQHHPLDWLADGAELEKLLRGRPHLLFCGHVHQQGVLVREPLGMPTIQLLAGAGYGEDAGQHAYSWGSLSATGIRYIPRAWSSRDSAFVPASFKSDYWNQSRDIIEYPIDRLPTALASWVTAAAQRQSRGSKRRVGSAEQVLEGDPWRDDDISVMAKMHDLYRIQRSTGTYLKVSFVIHANSLAPKGHPAAGQSDMIRYTLDFKPLRTPMTCHRFGVTSSRPLSSANSRRWIVRDRDGNPVKTLGFPMINPDRPGARFALLFFDPSLKAGQRYSLMFQDTTECALPDLAQSRPDEIAQVFDWAGIVPRAEIVLFLPDGATPVTMIKSKGNVLASGRPMLNGELASYPAPPGFTAVGWVGTGLNGTERFSVDLVPA